MIPESSMTSSNLCVACTVMLFIKFADGIFLEVPSL